MQTRAGWRLAIPLRPLAESALQYLSEGMTTIEEVAKLVEDVSESQIPLSKDIISQQGVEA